MSHLLLIPLLLECGNVQLTSKVLSEAGMHVLCDTPHVMSPYVRGTSVCVRGLTSIVSLDCSLTAETIGTTWREVQKVSQWFVSMALNGYEYHIRFIFVTESTVIWVGCPDQMVSHLIENRLLK